jgi:hypothetical protein
MRIKEHNTTATFEKDKYYCIHPIFEKSFRKSLRGEEPDKHILPLEVI